MNIYDGDDGDDGGDDGDDDYYHDLQLYNIVRYLNLSFYQPPKLHSPPPTPEKTERNGNVLYIFVPLLNCVMLEFLTYLIY